MEVAIPVSPTSSLLGPGPGGRLGYERRGLFGVPLVIGINLGYRYFQPAAINVEWFQTIPVTVFAGYRIDVARRVALESRLATAYGYNKLRYAASTEESSAGRFRTEAAFQPELSAGLALGVFLGSAWELRVEADYRLILERGMRFGAVAVRAGVQRIFADPVRVAPRPVSESELPPEPAPPAEPLERDDASPAVQPSVDDRREGEPAATDAEEVPERSMDEAIIADSPPAGEVGAPETPAQVSFSLQVLFEPNSSEITDPAREQLDRLAGYLERYRTNHIRVIGHVAAVGDPAVNLPLSRERAHAVRAYLISVHGFDPEALSAEGRGGDEPVADNTTVEGRALNRRVEIVVDVTEEDDATE